jgi:hypothetical protein
MHHRHQFGARAPSRNPVHRTYLVRGGQVVARAWRPDLHGEATAVRNDDTASPARDAGECKEYERLEEVNRLTWQTA